VICPGGHIDPHTEQNICARAADAIIREVHLKMAKAVANPILLKAGRWSLNPRSKGNFVYSFDGSIPFDSITSYEHILLSPFMGTGQLCPSLGWTCLLIHGVPTLDDNDTIFGPDLLLAETRTMLSLRKAAFALAPWWLRPTDSINTPYSSITFAISDPNGLITDTLFRARIAMFGKEVRIERWIDKPALTQCSHCHTLGHNKASKACPLGKDAVKCFKCGGAHSADQHNQQCPRKHAVAGIYDCKHFKCLNCLNTGHHARDVRCPSRNLYQPCTTCKANKERGKGKGRELPTDSEQESTPAPTAEVQDTPVTELAVEPYISPFQPSLFDAEYSFSHTDAEIAIHSMETE
jgi:hypothetical protein